MILALRNKDGDIIGICSYMLISENGKISKDGVVIIIDDVEVNKSCRNNGAIKKFMHLLLLKYPKAEKAFYERVKKYPKRAPIMITREQAKRRVGGWEAEKEH